MFYKYSNHFKFIAMIITGFIASCSTIVLAYMVQTLTNIATQKKWDQVGGFLTIVIIGFLLVFVASLIFNRLKTSAIQETNTYLRTNIFKGMLGTDRDENSNALGFLTNDFKLLETNRFDAQIEIIMQAKKKEVPVISSMGAGNKLDPTAFRVADIYKTKVCPLAKVMRRELKKRRVKKLKVVYSEEMPIKPKDDMANNCRTNCICPPGAQHKCTEKRAIPGSTAFVPSVAGLIIAGEVVKDLCKA